MLYGAVGAGRGLVADVFFGDTGFRHVYERYVYERVRVEASIRSAYCHVQSSVSAWPECNAHV